MTKQIIPVENLLVQSLGEEMVILNLTTETFYSLNGVGLRMWEVLTSGTSTDEAVRLLCDEYAVEEPILKRDLEQFIAKLQELSLIEVHEQA